MRLYILLLALLLTACSTVPQIGPVKVGPVYKMEGVVLARELRDMGMLDQTRLRDTEYLCPSLEFLKAMPAIPGDCDDSAFKNFAKLDTGKPSGYAIFVAYVLGTETDHALNLVRCSDGEWYWKEAQTGDVFPVKEGRYKTVYLVIL